MVFQICHFQNVILKAKSVNNNNNNNGIIISINNTSSSNNNKNNVSIVIPCDIMIKSDSFSFFIPSCPNLTFDVTYFGLSIINLIFSSFIGGENM